MTKPWYDIPKDQIYENLHDFSQSDPYKSFTNNYEDLVTALNSKRDSLNFPAVTNDVGNLLSFLASMKQPKNIFEFGSGYGHSAFWFLSGTSFIEKIILTEKRNDLEDVFKNLPWPKEWLEKIKYHQDDAFKVFEKIDEVDMILMDGQKSDYLKFLNDFEEKIKSGTMIIIDNSFWRGTFLNDELVKQRDSARKIGDLHKFLESNNMYRSVFLPYLDGVSLLIRN